MDTLKKSKFSTITNSWRASDLVVVGGRPSMGKTALMVSLALAHAGDNNIPTAIFSLELSKMQIAKRFATSLGMRRMPMYIIDKGAIDIDYLRIKVKHLCEAEGVRIIFVDYLQLMKGEELLKSLKSLATELNITIVCFSQLPRCIDERDDKRPVLFDLEHRAAGATEYADTILFLYREGYYDSSIEDNRVEIIVAKHYDDSLKDLELSFNKRQGIFGDK